MDTSRKGKLNKVQIDYGIPEYYEFYINKYKTDISSKEYNSIISDFNKAIASYITDDVIDFTIPFQLGILGIRKYKPEFKIDSNGKIINRLPVNPIETAKLWEKDPVAKAKKTLVRYTNKHSGGYVFSLYYFRGKAKFKHKLIYTLIPKRSLKRRVARNVKENLIDAFLLNQD